MNLSYSRALFGLALLLLVAVSLRPHPRAEQVLDLLLLPTRALAEVASPARLLSRGEVRAAERRLAEFRDVEHAASRALFQDERRAALPTEPELREGRTFLHAQVLARPAGKLDRLLIELDPGAGRLVETGMPVVSGDIYVGRVACVHRDRDQAAVDLVTGAAFFVGARLEAVEVAGVSVRQPVQMVVGGLAALRAAGPMIEGPEGVAAEVAEGAAAPAVVGGTGVAAADRVALAVHNPEGALGVSGVVRVDEGESRHEPYAREARGFQLGNLRRVEEELYEIEPRLDYLHGLFHVVVVRPDAGSDLASGEARDVLADGRWTRARAIGSGEVAPWREGCKLDMGSWRGLAPGAAVVCEARLIGRVQHVAPLTCDVAMLGDRGFNVPVLARVTGERIPRVLGRLVSLGRDPADGTVLLRWRPVQPIAADAPGPAELPAQLFTGAGELGLPRGLVIGDTFLPRGPGPHVLRVQQHVDTRDLARLWVRLPPEPPGDCP